MRIPQLNFSLTISIFKSNKWVENLSTQGKGLGAKVFKVISVFLSVYALILEDRTRYKASLENVIAVNELWMLNCHHLSHYSHFTTPRDAVRAVVPHLKYKILHLSSQESFCLMFDFPPPHTLFHLLYLCEFWSAELRGHHALWIRNKLKVRVNITLKIHYKISWRKD